MLGQDFTGVGAGRHEIIPLDLPEVDITDYPALEQYVESAKPAAVVHAAAFTAVDECERQPAVAWRVNAEGTRNVARACRKASAPLLYLSTDYVFDGEKTEPYVEEDAPHPVNVYGRSKLEGEEHVRQFVERFWIVRTSWLFGPLGNNFVRTILDRARRGETLRVVDDQFGAPTYTWHLAEALEQILLRGRGGIYHVTNQGYCSWFEFARSIVEHAGLEQVQILPIPTSASNRLARRPKNSRLAPARSLREGLDLLPHWEEGLRDYLRRESGTRNGSGDPSKTFRELQ